MIPIYIILFVCAFIVGYATHHYVYIPWREERRYRRVNRAALAMSTQRLERERERRAAIKNGRSERRHQLFDNYEEEPFALDHSPRKVS